MTSGDLRHILRAPFAEQILYNNVIIWAIVTRNDRSNINIRGVNNQSFAYNITIEISSLVTANSVDTQRVVVASKVTGDTVGLINLKGVLQTLRVSELIKYNEVSKSFELGLS